MEIVQVGKNTYYIENNTNIGIYRVDDKDVYLIDTGIDKDLGKKILKLIDEKNWVVKGIISTHSNADHIGGNKVIEERTNCVIIGHGIEKHFMNSPILEPSFLYGGYPFKGLRNKFLMAKGTDKVLEIEDNLPSGLEYFELKGHYFDMIGIKTSDGVYFLGDSLFSEETIMKYHVFFVYDVCEYLKTLDYLETLQGNLFIPSHVKATDNIFKLIDLNRKKIYEIEETLLDICRDEKKFDDILKEVCDRYQILLNTNQYVLVGSSIRSYLSWIMDNGKMEMIIHDNYVYFKRI